MTGARGAVVGRGITGLAAAYELSRGGDAPRVVVLEAGDRLGGKITTTRRQVRRAREAGHVGQDRPGR